jgi:hypothetical protein
MWRREALPNIILLSADVCIASCKQDCERLCKVNIHCLDGRSPTSLIVTAEWSTTVCGVVDRLAVFRSDTSWSTYKARLNWKVLEYEAQSVCAIGLCTFVKGETRANGRYFVGRTHKSARPLLTT